MTQTCQIEVIKLAIMAMVVFKVDDVIGEGETELLTGKIERCPTEDQPDLVCYLCYTNAKERNCSLEQKTKFPGPQGKIAYTVLKSYRTFRYNEAAKIPYCTVKFPMDSLKTDKLKIMKVEVCNGGNVVGECIWKFIKNCLGSNYGMTCNETCYCKNRTICLSGNESCNGDCQAGWRGDFCIHACGDQTFGPGCALTCHCLNQTEQCHHVYGRCRSGCRAGWAGADCQREISTTTSTKSTTSTTSPRENLTERTFHKQKCPPGFTLVGAGTCEDVDECSTNPDLCPSRTCLNTNGSFDCLSLARLKTESSSAWTVVLLILGSVILVIGALIGTVMSKSKVCRGQPNNAEQENETRESSEENVASKLSEPLDSFGPNTSNDQAEAQAGLWSWFQYFSEFFLPYKSNVK